MDTLAARLPEWLRPRLRALNDYNTRHEASHYGPTNGLLVHAFPLEDSFLVKPQPKIRPPADEDAGNTSLDSYAGMVPSRGDDESDIFIPDFVVVRAGPNHVSDRAIIVVENKLIDLDTEMAGSAAEDAKDQLKAYMNRLCEKDDREPIYGVLLTKTTAHVYRGELVEDIAAVKRFFKLCFLHKYKLHEDAGLDQYIKWLDRLADRWRGL